MPDKTIICKDCNAEFIFSENEQAFYKEKGFENEPLAALPAEKQESSRETIMAAEMHLTVGRTKRLKKRARSLFFCVSWIRFRFMRACDIISKENRSRKAVFAVHDKKEIDYGDG